MRTLLTLLAIGALTPAAIAPSPIQDGEAHGDPPFVLEDGWEPLLNGKDLTGWKACDATAKSAWYTTRYVMFERLLGPTRLGGNAAPSGVMLNGATGRTANLCTERTFGDIELYLEFMLAKGSNSGVYLHGLYEIQIFDSWGSSEGVKTSDAGAIYHRWIHEQGVGGSPPLVNAARRLVNGSRIRCGSARRASTRPARRPSQHDSYACSSTVSSCRKRSTSTVRRARASRYPKRRRGHSCPGRPWAGGFPERLRAAAAAVDSAVAVLHPLTGDRPSCRDGRTRAHSALAP